MRVTLVRHAESIMNTRPDLIGGRSNGSPLSALGRRQAEALRRRLVENRNAYAACYASPAVRALETARIALPGADIVVASEIQELSQGEWEGQPRADIYTSELLERIRTSDGALRPPEGESARDVQQRMAAWLESVAVANSTASDVIAFGHGYAIRALVGYVAGWDFNTIFEKVTPNTSVTVITGAGSVWRLLSFADAGHLGCLGPPHVHAGSRSNLPDQNGGRI